MNDQQWNEAFEKYKQIAQFKYINNHFTLADFKSIYFWEWLHRNWGRFMGIVFIVPFIWFIYKKNIDKKLLWPMLILLFLGGLQGAIGWIMVASGVGTELVYVDHIKLAIHFIAALILLVYVIWFALKITVPQKAISNAAGLKSLNFWILVLLTLQLIYGAFMAGTHAGKAAITWPTINGSYWPKSLFTEGSFFNDIINNHITIQFMHRNLAYLIGILVIVYFFKAARAGSKLVRLRWWPLLLVILQIILGVLTLVNYLGNEKVLLGVTHQLAGILLLIALIITYYYSFGKKKMTV